MDCLLLRPMLEGWKATANVCPLSRQQEYDVHLMVLAGMSSVTEKEVECAFQQAVHSSSVLEAVSPGVQLATAIHDTEIDRLLQKLVCGEVEYDPHDRSRYAHF